MKNAAFWDVRPPVLTSQEAHYVSATDYSLVRRTDELPERKVAAPV
jgi:hypothetical protein